MKFEMIHHADQKTIDAMYNEYSPVFILSTGRCGTKFLPVLLNHSSNVAAFHEPPPILEYFSHYAYHRQGDIEVLTRMIDAAKMEAILSVYIKDKIYIESNQCLTFFGPALAGLFKKSKFVHLVRHPGDFIRSAVRKGWHKNDTIWESGRVKSQDSVQWNEMDQVERLSWVWAATNSFIDGFASKLEPGRYERFKIEDLVSGVDSMTRLIRFTGAEAIPAEKIRQIQGERINELYIGPSEPPNMKKVLHFPCYSDWDRDLKEKLFRYAGALANLYGYEI